MRLTIPFLALVSLLACAEGRHRGPAEADTPPSPTPAKPKADGPGGAEPAKARPKGKDDDGRDTDPLADRKGIVADTRPGERPLVRIEDLPPGEPALVAFVVLDTVRADRTHLCGHDRPNTPVLDRIAKAATAVSCDAYSPATWTLPAHATYFTGATTAEHGVHTHGTPLSRDYETLAETYAARGYQTLLVSANPVFSRRAGGFWQGFDRAVAAEGLTGPLRGRSLAQILEGEFDRLDPEVPLFVFLNLFDAHDPYPAVPEGLDWVAPLPALDLLPHTAKPSNPYFRYVTGGMDAEEREPWLRRVIDAYDHAIYEADANLGRVLKGLDKTGWLARPHRMLVTSDHGEHLGEHGLLRHGSATWQTVTRIPFLWKDTTPQAEGFALPEGPVSAAVSFSLLRDGRLPDPMPTVESASAENPDDFKPSWKTVSVWGDDGAKAMYHQGERWLFDLGRDPLETTTAPLPTDHPLVPLLADRVDAHERSLQEALETPADPEVMEMLREVGYVQ